VPVAGSAPAPQAKPKTQAKAKPKRHKAKKHKVVVPTRRLDFLKLNELRHL